MQVSARHLPMYKFVSVTMKGKFAATAMLLAAGLMPAHAEDNYIFNHLGGGVGVGTTGVSVELATPITHFVQMRAGFSWMPSIKFHSDVDFTYNAPDADGVMRRQTGTVDLCGDLGRVQGQVIFNVYPIPKVPLYVAAGAYFGGGKLLKITGYSPDLASPDAQLAIGDYKIPADENGNISGGFKVNDFRPYVGIGWGWMIPGKLVNFSTELGVQFQNRPKLYTDYGEIDKSLVEDDNTFNKVADALRIYPTLTFRINFKAF